MLKIDRSHALTNENPKARLFFFWCCPMDIFYCAPRSFKKINVNSTHVQFTFLFVKLSKTRIGLKVMMCLFQVREHISPCFFHKTVITQVLNLPILYVTSLMAYRTQTEYFAFYRLRK